MATKKPENMSFEAAIEELDGLVDQLENGDLALDDALKNSNEVSPSLEPVKVN